MVTFKPILGLAVILAGGTLLAGCRHTIEHSAQKASIKDDMAPVSAPYASSAPQPSRKRVAAAKPRAERTSVAKPATIADREPPSKAIAAKPPMAPAPMPAPALPQSKTPAVSAPVVAAPSALAPAPAPTGPPASALQPTPTPTPTPAPSPKAASPSTGAPAVNGVRPTPEAPDPVATERQLDEGKRLFAEGRVIEARKRFVEALNGPIPDALLALARSFDTHYLSQLPRSDAAPDMQRALTLYTRASERGALDAAADLERVRNMLKQKQ